MAFIIYGIRSFVRGLGNLFRRVRPCPDYIVLTIEQGIPEMAPPRSPFPRSLFEKRPLTLRVLGKQLDRIGNDPRVAGIVLRLYNVNGPLAQLQSLRDLLFKLRESGKRVIVWSHNYDMAAYTVATAADEILLQHAGSVAAFGLESRYYFLADALAKVGIEGDLVQITPYKTAADLFMRTSMSDQAREMAAWLMDDMYRQHLESIAQGRSISIEAAEALIDGCPYHGEMAVEAGAVDAVVGEEDLAAYLSNSSKPVRMATLKTAKRTLLKPALPRPGKCVAVLRIAGDIIDGRSAMPPFKVPFRVPLLFSERAGDLTVVHQARALAKNKRVGAVVVYVDSGGGSATSSEAMAAALKTVADVKPLVVAMGSVAASGGYYVATPGSRIVAQPGTITGSIGVLSGKVVNAGLYEKILFHREILKRGKHAGYYSAAEPFTEEERASLWTSITTVYEQFLSRVSECRGLTRDAVDAVGGGRVWTGQQALEHGLVDELGGLDVAIQRARDAAGLRSGVRILECKPMKKRMAPTGSSATAILEYASRGLRLLKPGCAALLCSTVSFEND